MFGHQRRRNGAEDDGHESAEFKKAVTPGKFAHGQEFRQRAVFGRPKNRAVQSHEKYARQQQMLVPIPQSRKDDGHD